MELIYAYSRSDAIRDGMLIDVTKAAREYGFRMPVAMTQAVWMEYVAVPKACPWQDEAGRLADMLHMLHFRLVCGSSDAVEVEFIVYVQNDDSPAKKITLKAHCGPGDEGEPVVTIMKRGED